MGGEAVASVTMGEDPGLSRQCPPAGRNFMNSKALLQVSPSSSTPSILVDTTNEGKTATRISGLHRQPSPSVNPGCRKKKSQFSQASITVVSRTKSLLVSSGPVCVGTAPSGGKGGWPLISGPDGRADIYNPGPPISTCPMLLPPPRSL